MIGPADDELLHRALDGALVPDEATRLQARLAAEPELAARAEALRLVSDAVDRLGPAEPPAAFSARVMAEVQSASGPRPAWHRRLASLPAAIGRQLFPGSAHHSGQDAHEPETFRRAGMAGGGVIVAKKVLWGVAGLAVVVILAVVYFNGRTVDQGAQGTIGAADRYRGAQPSSVDAKPGNAQAFLQSDTFDKIVKNKEIRSLLSDASLCKLLADDKVQEALSKGGSLASLQEADAQASLFRLRLLGDSDIAGLVAQEQADLFARLSAGEQADLFARLSAGDQADLFARLEEADQAGLFARLADEKQAELFARLSGGDQADLFARLARPEQAELFARLAKGEQEKLFARLAGDQQVDIKAKMAALDDQAASFRKMAAGEQADLFARLAVGQRAALFARLAAGEQADLFARLAAGDQADLFARLADGNQADLFARLASGDQADLFARLASGSQADLFARLAAGNQAELFARLAKGDQAKLFARLSSAQQADLKGNESALKGLAKLVADPAGAAALRGGALKLFANVQFQAALKDPDFVKVMGNPDFGAALRDSKALEAALIKVR